MNSLGILRAVMDEPQTLRDLATSSGLSRTAVDAVAGDLVGMGWLEASEIASAGRLGRPAATYRLASTLGYFLSIDIGANHIYAVVTDLTGHVQGHLTDPIDEMAPAPDRVSAALDVSDRLLVDLGIGRDSLWVVTIGSPERSAHPESSPTSVAAGCPAGSVSTCTSGSAGSSRRRSWWRATSRWALTPS
ncbi:helix-turn-helix domain-containing protein [Leifsonia poae]|uniref:helix-turn-helix domain-containing protein n=1 Tax=Leifsonia poae TaxID=110933 RepID=UPI003D668971